MEAAIARAANVITTAVLGDFCGVVVGAAEAYLFWYAEVSSLSVDMVAGGIGLPNVSDAVPLGRASGATSVCRGTSSSFFDEAERRWASEISVDLSADVFSNSILLIV